MKFCLLFIPAILISSLPIINAQVNNCENDSTGFIPIVDMVTGKYMGYSGGLYPMSSNEAPAAHAKNGVYIAKTIEPLDKLGDVNWEHGRVIFIGMGNSLAGNAWNQ
jgi:hypothetical protein